MIRNGLEIPSSSFLSVDKDLSLIVQKLLNDKRLCKLLYYNTPDALEKPILTDDEKYGLLNKNIKIIPQVAKDSSVLCYVIISFDNFLPSENPEFRNNTISFDIICHYDQWMLKDSQLRPYKIAGQIDSLLDNKKLSGIGTLEFVGANQMLLNEEFAGISLMYQAVHGGEDKVHPLNPNESLD